ncbi:MAG: DNA polymerase III subunit alpha [Lactobacillus sp.]|jgi:DNA polymerase-3 subunit alpha|nr:DNA polymerase III subunit alpha [Lactobacillus sp.]
MKVAALQNLSAYTLLASPTRVNDLVKMAKQRGYEAAALTDVNVTYGLVDFYQAAQAAGVKPLMGMTARTGGIIDQAVNYDLLLIARTQTGYQNLLRLSSAINLLTENGENRKLLPFAELKKYLQDLVIIVPANDRSELHRLSVENPDLGAKFVQKLKALLGTGCQLYLGVYASQDQADYAAFCQELGKAEAVPLTAVEDCRYLNANDHFLRKSLQAIKNGTKLTDPLSLSQNDGSHWLRPVADLSVLYQDLGLDSALASTGKIAAACQVKLSFAGPELPVFKQQEYPTSQLFLQHLAQAGLKERRAGKIETAYQERLDYELKIIHQMGFDDYFLIVWDVMNFAHRQQITTGPGRGSACGSLVSYALRITEVDPLKYHLLFERFLNPARQQMPDIDLDIPDNRRDEVIQYMFKKYGMDHAAQILTFGTLAAKQALRDCSRIFCLTKVETQKFTRSLPFSKQALTLTECYQESKQLQTQVQATPLNQLLFKTACGLEGLPRHYSIHAAGLVISDHSIASLVGLQAGPLGIPVTQQTKNSVERLGLLKIDFLGLRNLTILGTALRLAGLADPNKIPLDDPATLQLFQAGQTDAIFQFESTGIKRVLKRLHPDNFEDIVAVNALYRPGPMQNIDHFIARKNGKEAITYPDPSLQQILAPTYGILVYQEQVMQTAQVLAGFSLGQADLLRRAMSKKKQDVIDQQRGRFIAGAVKLGHQKAVAEKVYQYIEQFANYGFNRSHAVAYSEIAFWLAYLKVHYPGAFYTALLNANSGDKDKVAAYLTAAKEAGLQVFHPDINHSQAGYLLQKKAILVGFSAIKGLRRDLVEAIVTGQPYASLTDFLQKIPSKFLHPDAIKRLIKAGCFDNFDSNRQSLLAQTEQLVESVSMSGGNQSLLAALAPKPVAVKPPTRAELAAMETEVMGFATTLTPLIAIQKFAKRYQARQFNAFAVNERGIVAAQLVKIKLIRTKRGQTMAFASFNDGHSRQEVVVFPRLYERFSNVLEQDGFYLLQVQTRSDRYDQGQVQFILTNLRRVQFKTES